MPETFSIGQAIGYGWEKMKKHFWFFAGLLVVVWLLQVIPNGIAEVFKNRIFVFYLLFLLAAAAVQIIVQMGLIKIVLDLFDRDKAELNTLFSQVELFWKFFLGSLLYMLILTGGLILLIVPGIIWGIKYQFCAYLIIDKKLSPVEAIRKSGEMTLGNKGKLFWLNLLLLLINLLGLLCFLIGLFVTIPVTLMASVYVYRKLLNETPDSAPAGQIAA